MHLRIFDEHQGEQPELLEFARETARGAPRLLRGGLVRGDARMPAAQPNAATEISASSSSASADAQTRRRPTPDARESGCGSAESICADYRTIL
jgi:hypothetical protein